MIYNLVNTSEMRMPRKFIKIWLREVHVGLIKRGIVSKVKRELTVVFLGKIEAKRLNHKYRQKNYPTDVLSFDGDGTTLMGELVLCPTVIKSQAFEHKLNFRQELGYLLLHGILHLLGYDHEKSEKEALKMFAIQDEIFDQLCRKFWK